RLCGRRFFLRPHPIAGLLNLIQLPRAERRNLVPAHILLACLAAVHLRLLVEQVPGNQPPRVVRDLVCVDLGLLHVPADYGRAVAFLSTTFGVVTYHADRSTYGYRFVVVKLENLPL